ncbi:hypothetical protein CcaverHIS002_0700720 [Cutaneotrichosporon cavernicola]|uniref:Alpha/beta hydrolase fold-3 domain-containing protein n=1 Tax=Cutaneotrichosporon cavernicola TaxID=279322 RepID=A0AA48QYL1_9TREE|nr:uncharacterized protein CcaverHIS019_0700730 [Cutaneotrichosporon cavernicola]BEI86726.1 hypothetical protein CcaverHIS002_0700720 [Cutaneotrichosporon cavernicola]BEI94501.1 hypothetical protein CcaverHIS019_0700730 [Cutaneotrichosporon cavernicola]BEJ02277.1 hypothetical protein CcaverHIS631_0700720 [Cutaneotrichosporon cavernicola]BEJ10036.1 hypothetical protein CcaverHIS641_0700710 [Cutaneotrichosporon cavernicola]
MPTSREGFEYTRYLFKEVAPSMTGGCHADVWMPLKDKVKGGRVPVGITYHGGGFTTADSQHVFTGHIEHLLERGFAVVSLEYRMCPHVRLPEIREDLLDGYRWVLQNLPKIHPELDPERNFVFGGSAGGTSAMLVSIDAAAAGLPLPKANYIAYPLSDTNARYFREYKPYEDAMADLSEYDKKKVDDLLFEPVSTAHDVWAEDGSSPRATWASMAIDSASLNEFLTSHAPPYPDAQNPIKLMSASFPPSVWVLAADDSLLDPQQTRDGHARLLELGVESKLIEAQGMPHGALEPGPGKDGWKERFWPFAQPALEFCVAKCAKRGWCWIQ